jgi:hypothetical protein
MFKGKFVALSLVAAALLCWQIAGVDTATGGFVDPCSSSATSANTDTVCYVVCPQGDGDRLDGIGATISVQVRDDGGVPVPGIPPADYWLDGCTGGLVLCAGGGAAGADSASNASGWTTISGTLSASSCDTNGVSVIVQGVIIADPANCSVPLCLPIRAVSPDISGEGGNVDGIVELFDLSAFATDYTHPPKAYNGCLDYNCDGLVELIDFSIFAQHYLHEC